MTLQEAVAEARADLARPEVKFRQPTEAEIAAAEKACGSLLTDAMLKLDRIKEKAQKYNNPGVNVATHSLANEILKIVEE